MSTVAVQEQGQAQAKVGIAAHTDKMVGWGQALAELAEFCGSHSNEVSGQQRWQIQWIRGTAARLAEEVQLLAGNIAKNGTVAYTSAPKSDSAKAKAKQKAAQKAAAKKIADAQELLAKAGAMVVFSSQVAAASAALGTATPPLPATVGEVAAAQAVAEGESAVGDEGLTPEDQAVVDAQLAGEAEAAAAEMEALAAELEQLEAQAGGEDEDEDLLFEAS